jgi:hypothetical protein
LTTITNWIDPRQTEREEFSVQTTVVSGLNSSIFAFQGPSGCSHPRTYWLFTQNDHLPAFCGLCWLTEVWEDEVPRRLHAYKQLAENGKPELSSQFRRHLEVNMGLVPPKPGENLRQYRLAREQYTRKPRKNDYPVTAALYQMMGSQPIIAQSLFRSLCGQELVQIAEDLHITPYGAYQATAKGIRMVLRYIRN